jgi:transcriptional regulator with XRE-family HTH domain
VVGIECGNMRAVLDSPVVAGQRIDLEKIRSLRDELGLGQAEAAGKAGIPGGASAWSDIENGRRANMKFETLARIADTLGCDVRDLITDPVATGKRDQ